MDNTNRLFGTTFCGCTVADTAKTTAPTKQITNSLNLTNTNKMTLKLKIVLIALMSLFAINGAKADVIASGKCGTSNNLTWELTDDGILTITGSGKMEDYLAAHNPPWYQHRDKIDVIVLPDGLTSIGKYAFNKCNVLSITIPNSVDAIGESAFESCGELTSVVIGSSVKKLLQATFMYCSSLSKVTLGSSVEKLEYVVFKGCTALDTIICKSTIPPSISTLSASHSFYGVNQTVKIIVPCGKEFDYKASDWGDKFGTANVKEDCGTPPTITTSSLPNGTVGTAYSQTLTATGTTPITWSIASGNLPAGLTISSSGTISGTPTTEGTYNFTVKATNNSNNDTKALSIVIEGIGSVNEIVLSGKVIYPNLVSNNFFIDYASNYTVKLYDVSGKEVLNQNNDGGKTEIDISYLPKGVYVVRLLSEAKIIGHTKIVKE